MVCTATKVSMLRTDIAGKLLNKMPNSIFMFFVYDPANGEPKMPTASSAQMRKSATRIPAMQKNRCSNFFTFLITSSLTRPAPSSRIPMTTKSNRVQFTSSVNCIAINGMSNIKATVSKMPVNLLFCVIMMFCFY